MAEPILFFFDFDGVICDSIDECLLSSWLAYYRYFLGEEPSFLPLNIRSRFAALRPFIRNGEDYLLIHQLQAEKEQEIHSQADFDTRLIQAGKARMQEYRNHFYAARSYLLKNDFSGWCLLNRLYPHMLSWLEEFLPHPAFYILSTKKPQYILEILKYNHLPAPEERVLCPGSETKKEIIDDVCGKQGAREAVFVDDQIDHLSLARGEHIRTYLPDWGYIQQEWLTSDFPVLNANNLGALFSLLRSAS